MKTEYEKIVDEVVTYNVNANRKDGDTRIFTPGAFVADVFAEKHRNNDMFNTLLGIMDVNQLVEAEALVEDALSDADDRSAVFYGHCMALGEQLVLAIQTSIAMKLRADVQKRMKAGL